MGFKEDISRKRVFESSQEGHAEKTGYKALKRYSFGIEPEKK